MIHASRQLGERSTDQIEVYVVEIAGTRLGTKEGLAAWIGTAAQHTSREVQQACQCRTIEHRPLPGDDPIVSNRCECSTCRRCEITRQRDCRDLRIHLERPRHDLKVEHMARPTHARHRVLRGVVIRPRRRRVAITHEP